MATLLFMVLFLAVGGATVTVTNPQTNFTSTTPPTLLGTIVFLPCYLASTMSGPKSRASNEGRNSVELQVQQKNQPAPADASFISSFI